MKDRGFINGLRPENGARVRYWADGNGSKDGLINGNSNNKDKKEKPKKSMMSTPSGRMGAWAVIGVVLLLIFGAFAISTHSFKTTDWNLIKKYNDYDILSVEDSNIDINKFAFHLNNGVLEFYLSFVGDFGKADTYKNLAYIFIDNDSNPLTGYDAGYLGADYMVKITGEHGKVRASFLEFNAMHRDVWNWSVIGTVSVIRSGDHAFYGSTNYKISKDAKLFVLAQHEYIQDITPVVGIEKPAILIIEKPIIKNGTLELNLWPMYGAVNVDSITLNMPMGVQIPQLSGDKLTVGTVTLPKKVYLEVDSSNVPKGAIKVDIAKVSTNVPYTVWGKPYVEYVGTPDGIEVDGCFADWNALATFYTDTPTNDVANPNINILRYASYNVNGAFFYASVKGAMLKGNIAPEMEETSKNWTNVTPIPKQPGSPYDYAEVDFTTQDGTEHTIIIKGYMGKIVSITMDGKKTSKVKAAVGYNGAEGALEIGYLENVNITKYTIKMTDWNGASDYITYTTNTHSRDSGGNATLPEINATIIIPLLLIATFAVIRRKKNTR